MLWCRLAIKHPRSLTTGPTAAPLEEGPQILETEREPQGPGCSDGAGTIPTDWNASYNPPEAIPEGYDI